MSSTLPSVQSGGSVWAAATIASFGLAGVYGLVQGFVAALSASSAVRWYVILPPTAVCIVVLAVSVASGLVFVRRYDAEFGSRELAWRTGVLAVPAILLVASLMFVLTSWRDGAR